jgi:prepilin-type N-terminal cleavage/methylation domain-containing protein/prepilin-type processing-associated H-X9-DG protein
MPRLHLPVPWRRRSAFTLVELLVVIAIIGVLIGLLLPAVQKVREAANRIQCSNNLKQLGVAAHHYHDVRKHFPTGLHMGVNMGGGRWAGGTSWMVELLPYIEQDNLYNQWDYNDFRNNVAGGVNSTTAQIIQIDRCPSDQLNDRMYYHGAIPEAWGYFGLGSYGGNAGRRSYPPKQVTRDGIFAQDSSVSLADIRDGSSNTLLFGERSHRDQEYDQVIAGLNMAPLANVGGWSTVVAAQLNGGPLHNLTLSTAVPINFQVPPGTPVGDLATIYDRLCAFGSSHPGGANFALGDGSVRFLSDQTPLATLQALSTRARGEVVSVP